MKKKFNPSTYLQTILLFIFFMPLCVFHLNSCSTPQNLTHDPGLKVTEPDYPLPKAEPEKIGLSSKELKKMGTAIKKGVEDGDFPGAVVLIAHQGKIGYFESFGIRDETTKAPMKKDSIFRIYSMTKPITSVAVLMLVDDKKLDLDDPISKYIHELGGLQVGVEDADGNLTLVPSNQDMTIRDLLRHTSGLTYGVFFTSEVKTLYLLAGIHKNDQTLSELITKLSKMPLAYDPGTRWEYGRSTDVLGYLIEVVSGKTLDQFFEERIFTPLKMVDTGFYVSPEKIHRLAQPGKYLDVKQPPELFSGGGGLTSTAGDYVRFAQMLLNGGELEGVRIIQRDTVELMTRDHLGPMANRSDPQYFPGKGSGFGLGVAVLRKQGILGPAGFYTWSGWAGTTFGIDPKNDVISILMFQNPPMLTPYVIKFNQLKAKTIVN